MSRNRWRRLFSFLLLAGMLLGFAQPGGALASRSPQLLAVPASQGDTSARVEPLVQEQIAASGSTDFFIWMKEKADLSLAKALKTKAEKGQFVFDALRETAERTQKDLRAYLDQQGVDYKAFYIANKILVKGGEGDLLSTVAARSDVSQITANHTFQLQEPFKNAAPEDQRTLGIESNISFVEAPAVWALGYTGQGIVLAGNDTGLDETHPAIAPHYRGCIDPPTCSSYDHNYNWWDATGTYPTNPWDGFGHGTHTTGTMVGDDGGSNQIGMAPGAQTIHCKNMTDGGSGDDGTFTECFQWDLAPWDLSGANPDPAMAPDAVNNSWGYWGGNAPQFEDEIAALQAAGVLVEVSAGNEGSGCQSLRSPGDYLQVLTTGSIQHAGGSLPGTITGFSSRGPSALYPDDYFPDVMAPGENIRSSVPGGGYEGGWSGTSMAGPHSVGLVGLMWSASPGIRGDVELTNQIIKDTAFRLAGQGGSNCGGDYTNGPNNDWGYGTIDALPAVEMAITLGGAGWLNGTVTDASSGDPIFLADITAEGFTGHDYSATTDVSGYYTTTVVDDVYTVTASAYGYFPQIVTDVTVITDEVTTQNFALTVAPTYLVTGTVTDATSGLPLQATIAFDGAPVQVETDPATGVYSAGLVPGSYTMHVFAGWHKSAQRDIVVVVGESQQQDFSLDMRPCILLVDDDQDSPNVAYYYTLALNDLGYDYEVWDVKASGNPDKYSLYGYNTIWWYTGAPETDVVTKQENEPALSAYLDAGGNLLLSSQGYLSEADPEGAFLNNYLGVAAYDTNVNLTNPTGAPGDPIGDGLGPYSLIKPSGWSSLKTDSASGIQGTPFEWFGQAGAGNSARYATDVFKTVFLGWPLETTSRLSDREEALGAIQNYFGGCAPASGTLSGQVRDALSGDPLGGATVTAQPGGLSAVTDELGGYSLELAAGIYTVTAEATGYVTQVKEATVPAGVVTVVDFELEPLPPEILVEPKAFTETLTSGNTLTATLTVSNLGAGVLSFSIADPEAGWFNIDPISGELLPEDSLAVNVTFDASLLAGGTYTTTLLVVSNDPIHPLVEVPVELTVLPAQQEWKVFLPVITH